MCELVKIHLQNSRRTTYSIRFVSSRATEIQGIFRSGRPVIFVGGRENEIAEWITESGGGWCVAENDVDGLARAVAEAGDPAERARRGIASARYAVMHFSCEANCGRMAEMLDGR